MVQSFEELILRAKKSPKKICVASAEDEHVLEAVLAARKAGIAQFVLTGDQGAIEGLMKKHHANPADFEIIAADSFEDSAKKAVEAVSSGRAGAIMKGLTPSPTFLKAILSEGSGLKIDGNLLAHVALMKVPGWEKMFFASDCAVNISPSAQEKKQIIGYAVQAAKKLGMVQPKVALVTASEAVNPKMKDTLDAAELLKMKESGDFPELLDGILGGPFALDNAISKEAAAIKKVTHPGAGEADILILPDLSAANIFYKSLIFYAKAQSAGMILGAKAPIILVSRSDSEESKLFSMALACVVSA